jgi:hypothetical protein
MVRIATGSRLASSDEGTTRIDAGGDETDSEGAMAVQARVAQQPGPWGMDASAQAGGIGVLCRMQQNRMRRCLNAKKVEASSESGRRFWEGFVVFVHQPLPGGLWTAGTGGTAAARYWSGVRP